MRLIGKCSQFGGADDKGMVNDTGLAFYEPHEADLRPDLFNPGDKTVPTWKRLKTEVHYIALNIPLGADREWAQQSKWVIRNPRNYWSTVAHLVDRGPGAKGRVVDCSPGLMKALNLNTDDVVEIQEILYDPRFA